MEIVSSLLQPILFLAQEQEGGGDQPGILEVFAVPIMVMIAVYVVLVLLPQNRERKNREEFLNNLKKNDQVVTLGGIFGTVSGFSADGSQVTLRVDDNTRIRVRKTSIESVVKSEGDDKKGDEKSA